MTTVDVHPLSLANLLRPVVRANPYPLYHALRSADPVHWDEALNFWVVTRHADVVGALHSPRLSKAKGIATAISQCPPEVQDAAQPLYRYFSKTMLYADPPYHTQLRALVNKAFTPRVVERMRDRIQRIVDRLLDAVEPRRQMDVISDLAFPLPATVIMDMLGLPHDRREQFKQWSDRFSGALGIVRRDPAVIRQALQALAEFSEYLPKLEAQRRQQPQDDLLNALFRVEEQGTVLSQEELVANALLLVAAGHETTVNLIGNGVLALLRHPEQMEALEANPALIPAAVEEILRYDNPVQIVWRQATDDIDIGGQRIPAGQNVNLMIGAANRDPAQFPEPDRFDLARRDARHVGFGQGIHYCFGAPLARLEGEITLTTLLRRMPGLRLAAAALEWQENPTFRGLKSLPVEF